MKDWMKEGYSLGDTRSRAQKRTDRQKAMYESGITWRGTRRRNK